MRLPKPCATKPKGKNKGLKRLLEHGEIYGGRFNPTWGADKSGRSAVLVLRDEGTKVLVAPVAAASQSKPSKMRIKIPKGSPLKFSGVVLLDLACSIDKKLLDRKMGELPRELMGAVDMATFGGS